jgi:hypothetical protein
LSQAGNSWIYDDSMVFDNARVSGESKIYGNIKVRGGNTEINKPPRGNNKKPGLAPKTLSKVVF